MHLVVVRLQDHMVVQQQKHTLILYLLLQDEDRVDLGTEDDVKVDQVLKHRLIKAC